MQTKPYVREFSNEQEVEREVIALQSKGVNPSNIYVLTHNQERTDRIASKAGANTIGTEEQELGTLIYKYF